ERVRRDTEQAHAAVTEAQAADACPINATPTAAVTPPPPVKAETWDSALEQSECFGIIESANTVDPRMAALNAIGEAIHFDTCWLFQRTPNGSGFTLTTAAGANAGNGRDTPAYVQPGERTVFGVCLQRREVVVLHDTFDRTITR